MKHSQIASAALIALALAACTKTADPNAVATNTAATGANAAEMLPSDEASNAMNGDTPATNIGNGAAPAKLPTAIPAQFHGRWGINKADCTSTRGDSKGLLTINDARLTFYESRGTINKVLGATANSFDARYDFAGEGQTWARTERLKLVDGKLNRRTDAEPDQEPPVNLTYSRCAN